MSGILGWIKPTARSQSKCLTPCLSQITRCISYHSPVFRPRFLLNERARRLKRIGFPATPPQLLNCSSSSDGVRVQLYSQSAANKVFTFNGRVNMLRKRISFSGTPGGPEGSQNVIPIGLITPENKDGKDLKIVIVPLDIAGMDANQLKETLTSINQLRKYANEIDAFSSSMVDDFNAMMREANSQAAHTNELAAAAGDAAEEQPQQLQQQQQKQPPAAEDAEFWQSYTTAPSAANMDIDAIAKGTAHLGGTAAAHEQQAIATGAMLDSNVTTSSLPAATPARLPTTTQPKVQTQDQAKAHTQAKAKVQLESEEQAQPQPQDNAQPLPKTLPIQDPVQAQPQAGSKVLTQLEPAIEAAELEALGDDLQGVKISVPRSLSDRLNDLAISSMELSFEMDMTNVRDAIECKQTGGQALMPNNPVVSMNTRVELATPGLPDHTVPLHFNALIAGVVNVDMKKLDLESMTEDQVPDFNDDVTSLAANLCSAALENGLCVDQSTFQQAAPMIDTPAELSDKELSEMTDQELAALKNQYAARLSELQHELCAVEQMDPAMTVAAIAKSLSPERELPQISAQARTALNRAQGQKHMKQTTAAAPLQVRAASAEPEEQFQGPMLRDGCKHGVIKPKKKCKKKCPLDDPCKEDKCKRPKKGDKKSKKKKASLNATQIRASGGKSSCGGKKDAKKADPCAKKGGKGDDKGKKKDPCAKFKKDGGKKKDPCAKKDGGKKNDPCAKKDGGKKKDPCAKKGDKDGKKKDPCAKFKKGGKDDKKKDPCAKKDGGKDKKKKDPCAKFKSGAKKDPCAKKDDKKKKDPCAKFKSGEKKDPCAKKDDKKKKDPCAKFKSGAKKDPCAKKDGGKDKKKDPCAKFKKGGKDDKKKKDPCAKKDDKKKKDPCAKKDDKKKKDPCAKKDDKKKKDPCAKFKKGGDDKKKNDPCKKKYSTFASPFLADSACQIPESRQAAGAPVRYSSRAATPCRYLIYSTLVRRHYGGKPTRTQLCGLTAGDATTWHRGYAKGKKDGKKEDGGKCSVLEQKFPLNRGKDKKARTKARTDCYIDGEECPKKFCTGNCGTVRFPRKKCDKSKKKKGGKKNKSGKGRRK